MLANSEGSPCPEKVSQIRDTAVLIHLVSVVSTQKHDGEDCLRGHPGLMPSLDPQVSNSKDEKFRVILYELCSSEN